jgi:Flp pilus assembly protein TadG
MAALTIARLALSRVRRSSEPRRSSPSSGAGTHRLRSERGAELLEFALVLPLVLLVLAGIIDMGFLFKDFEVLTNAAREGARMAALPGWTESDVVERVNSYLTAGGYQTSATTTVQPVTLVTSSASGRSIDGIKVTVTSPHSYLILGPIVQLVQGSAVPNTTLRAVATMRVEMAAGL